MRRSRRTFGLTAVVATLAAAAWTGSAQATTTFDFQFGSDGTGAGQFSTPSDIAVDQATGDIYVSDRALHRISKFNEAGQFQLMWGQDVVSSGPDNTGTGFEICNVAANPTDVCKTGITGSSSGAMNQPQGVGVDSITHDVYVQDTGNIRVQKFDANGNFILMWGKGVNETTGSRVCPEEPSDVCKIGTSSGVASTEEPSELGVFFGWHGLFGGENENRSSLTVDSEGYVYVGECCSIRTGVFPDVYPDARVQKFDSDGNFVSVLAPPEGFGNELRRPHSLAVDSSGDFYVRDDPFESAARGVIRYLPQAFTATISASTADKWWGEATGFNELPLAIDPTNDFIFALEGGCALSSDTGMKLVEYQPSNEEVDCTAIPNNPTLSQSKAFATAPGHKLYLLVDGSPDRVIVYNTPSATSPEVIGEPEIREITTSKAVAKTSVRQNLDYTSVHVEYGTAPCFEIECQSTPESPSIGASYRVKGTGGVALAGLEPATTYHYRFVATNGAGSVTGPEGAFRTYPESELEPKCPNNLARQQTHAALLLDCRAYELVSPEEQGGYDVESSVIAGQEPFGGFPLAHDKTLFGIHDGGIPGIGKPTNRGVDPYVATRNPKAERWDTSYVGIPADAPSAEPFSSTVSGADSTLDTFSFGGSEICDPCFGDGTAGSPLRRPDGSLVQGMAGSEPVADPTPVGEVRKHLSADGRHFVFGSEQLFEPEGNDENGNVTIYDRNLDTGQTQVVSTMPDSSTIEAGDEVAEFDMSRNGSRIIFGILMGEDSEGNRRWHPYMHIGTNSGSYDLAPGTTTGVQYAGMTDDGSKFFFTSRDKLTADDHDTSVDLFEADVTGGGAVTIKRISTGVSGTGDTDACDPENNSYNEQDWNTIPGGPTDCSVVAVGGGGGVATSNGTVYFLSPEPLDENGTPNAANLFVAHPGEDPQFVQTLESGGPSPAHNVANELSPFTHTQGAAIDSVDGSMYVYDVGNAGEFGGPGASVTKFSSSGEQLSKFTGAPGCSTFQSVGDTTFLSEFGLTESSPTQIAVDNMEGSPSYRDLYVTSINGFSGFRVEKFNPSGACVSQFSISGEFWYPGAISVDPTTGKVYVGVTDLFGSPTIKVFNGNEPNTATAPTSFAVSGLPIGIAVDGSTNKVYVANGSNTTVYNAETGAPLGETLDPNSSYGVAVDLVDHHIYVDRGDRVIEYNTSGEQVGPDIGVGVLTGMKSRNLAAYGGRLVVSNWGSGNAIVFSPIQVGPGRSYDSPLAIHSVREAETRHTEDFQTTADGGHAVFPSVLPLTGFDSSDKYELYRYDLAANETDCLSCDPTLGTPETDATLAADGLSISKDGRVFFNTGEPLVVRDTNDKRDVYEWKDGRPELISSGQDRSDSGLLTVSEDGVDAFFFTRETLADNNGTLMKLYDAREEGGFFVIPPPPGCRASDECHGASSAPPLPLSIGTIRGTRGNVSSESGCNTKKLTRKAKSLSHQASKLRRQAKKASGLRKVKLRNRSGKKAKAARKASKAAKRCRRQGKTG